MNKRTIILLAGIMVAGLAVNNAFGQSSMEKKTAKAEKAVEANVQKASKAAAKVEKKAVKIEKKAVKVAQKASAKAAKLEAKAGKAVKKQKAKVKSATK